MTKEEYNYLRAVCKLYKVKFIRKLETGRGIQFKKIVVGSSIYCGLTVSCSMPFGKKDSMYKGMEVNRYYTIEELKEIYKGE